LVTLDDILRQFGSIVEMHSWPGEVFKKVVFPTPWLVLKSERYVIGVHNKDQR
jgi:hypothetical protein